jgi:hypothetical protein
MQVTGVSDTIRFFILAIACGLIRPASQKQSVTQLRFEQTFTAIFQKPSRPTCSPTNLLQFISLACLALFQQRKA